MTCGQCDSYDSVFSKQRAERDLRRYHTKGPDKTTRLLLNALKALGVQGMSVLDIGAGIGVVQHELLTDGAASALHVDATTSNIRIARQEATRQGHADRVTFLQGDFVALAPDVRDADVVTLDRVICCYPNMKQLVAASASRARRFYGVVFPRERWFNRAFVATENLVRRLTGNAFRSYIHPVQAIDAAIRSQGLSLDSVHETVAWRVAVYTRRVG